MDAALNGEVEDLHILVCYATISQKEGIEPDASRIAPLAHSSLDKTQDILNRLSSKGWLGRVKDYGEIIRTNPVYGLN